jgi:BRCA1-associated RING domain protein 1
LDADVVLASLETSQEVLGQFQSQTGVPVTNNWIPNVTHVVANTDENGACGRTLKVLLAILAGKWVVNVNCKYSY